MSSRSRCSNPLRRNILRAVVVSAACATAAIGWGLPQTVQASPGLEGTRNLAMGNSARASASGTSAAMASSATLSFSQQFAIEPSYQFALRDRTHGLGINIVDSLLNPRLAIGLGYAFMRGSPRVSLPRPGRGSSGELELSHFGHEASLLISVSAVRNWLAIALKPKYQYTSLRYLDDEGGARNATDKLSAFGLDGSIALNFADWVRVSVVGYNLVGVKQANYTDDEPLSLEGGGDGRGSRDRRRRPSLRGCPARRQQRAPTLGLSAQPCPRFGRVPAAQPELQPQLRRLCTTSPATGIKTSTCARPWVARPSSWQAPFPFARVPTGTAADGEATTTPCS